MKITMTPELQAIIHAAVQEGIAAGKSLSRKERTTIQRTEARLYAIPGLRTRIEDNRAERARLEAGGALPERSRDVVRFRRAAPNLSAEELLDARIEALESEIAADLHEVATIEQALTHIAGAPYYRTVPARYFEGLGDDEAALELNCDPRTVARQRIRLLERLAVLLYGVEALEE